MFVSEPQFTGRSAELVGSLGGGVRLADCSNRRDKSLEPLKRDVVQIEGDDRVRLSEKKNLAMTSHGSQCHLRDLMPSDGHAGMN
jgi:hypothetical protein